VRLAASLLVSPFSSRQVPLTSRMRAYPPSLLESCKKVNIADNERPVHAYIQ
jgi:hypothetical protein